MTSCRLILGASVQCGLAIKRLGLEGHARLPDVKSINTINAKNPYPRLWYSGAVLTPNSKNDYMMRT